MKEMAYHMQEELNDGVDNHSELRSRRVVVDRLLVRGKVSGGGGLKERWKRRGEAFK